MEIQSGTVERPDVSPEERQSHELMKQFLKLRWIGLEREAEQIQLMNVAATPSTLLRRARPIRK